MNFSF